MADVPDLNQITNTTNQQRLDTANFMKQQGLDTSNFLNQYTGFVNQLPTTQSLATKLGNELNIPTLRSNANVLRTSFANIPFTYRDAIQGTDVNQNQLDRIIGRKSYEMAPALTSAENALTTGENALNLRLGYAQSDIARQLLPMQAGQQLLSERLARETSLFTSENERELNGLIAKINAGVTLSEGEKNRANQLAIAEKGYQNALELTKFKASQPYPISAEQGIYNPSNNTYQQFGWG